MLEVSYCRTWAPRQIVGPAAVTIRLAVLGIGGDGPVKLRHGLRVPAHVAVEFTPVEARLGVGGCQLKHRVQVCQGFFEPAAPGVYRPTAHEGFYLT
jgi:hypothetical protein